MRRREWLILLVLMATEVVASLESGMVIAGIPKWVHLYGDPVRVGWLVSSFLVVQAAAAAVGGRLGDIYGRKPMMLIALATCAIGSVISTLTADLDWMIVGRVVQGAAGAVLPLSLGLTRECLPREKVSFGISAIVATMSAAGAVGLLIGGYLVDTLGPQGLFASTAVTSVVAFTLVFLGLPQTSQRSGVERLDWVGGVAFIPGIVCVLVAISRAEKVGLTHPMNLALFSAGLAILVFWVVYELRQDEPLFDIRLLANRNILLANVVMGLLSLGAFQGSVVISMLLQQPTWTMVGLGISATLYGLLSFPTTLSGIASSMTTGWAANRWNPQLPMAAGAVLAAAAFAFVAVMHGSLPVVFVGMLLFQAGMMATYAAVPIVIVSSAPSDRTSEAAGFTGVMRSLSRAIGMQLTAVLLSTSTIRSPDGLKFLPDERAYRIAFGAMAALTFLAAVAALAIRTEEPRRTADSLKTGAAARRAAKYRIPSLAKS